MKSNGSNKPHLIIMIGIPGSGKSFFAEHFAETFKAPIVSYEKIRNEIFEKPDFSKNQEEIIEQIANYFLEEISKTKQTIIFDGDFGSRTSRDQISKKARNLGYEPIYIWSQIDILTAKKRSTRSLPDKTPISSEQFDYIVSKFTPPSKFENSVVISGKHTYASQLKIVLKYLVDSPKYIKITS